MARKTAKQKAAANREATKRQEPVPFPLPIDPALGSDPSFEPGESDSDDGASEGPSLVPVATSSSSGLKRKNPDADLHPARESEKKPRTTAWREDTNKTKKARAKKMQPSVTTFFKVAPKGKNSGVAVREESEEPDSDIEMIDAPSLKGVEVEATSEAAAVRPVQVEPLEPVLEVSPTVDGYQFPDDVVLDGALPAPVAASNAAETAVPGVPVAEPNTAAAPSTEPGAHPVAPSPPVVTPTVVTLPADTEADIKAAHARLQKLIKKNRAELTRKAAILTNAKAASSVMDLEALSQFNDKSFELALKRLKLIKSLSSATRARIPQIKKKIRGCNPRHEASLAVSHRCGKGPYYARSIRKMADHLLAHGVLPENEQGKGAHHESLLLNPAIREALQEWVKGTLEVEKGGFVGRMRPAKMRRYINEFLLPELKIEATISETTAVRWLKRLGFRLARVQKGVYVDGHERPDVVESREKLLEYLWLHVFPFCYKYNGESLEEIAPELKEGEKIHYPISHDECCVHANDQVNFEWLREGEQPLRNKSRGRIVHLSSLILENCGHLRLTEAEIQAQLLLPKEPLPPAAAAPAAPSAPATNSVVDPTPSTSSTEPAPPAAPAKKRRGKAKKTPVVVETPTSEATKGRTKAKNSAAAAPTQGRTYAENDWVPPPPPAPHTAYQIPSFDADRIIYPGANHDPWWDMPQLIAQIKAAIKIFNVKFPNGIAVFIFDCSSAHEAFASDALQAHKMNRGSGGKQPRMRDTVIPATGEPQSMNFPDDYKGVADDGTPLAGKPKGMEQVLRERDLLSVLEAKHGKKVVGVCKTCKLSQAAREKAMKDAKSKEDEAESGIGSLGGRGVSEMEDADLERDSDCCMQRVLSLQADFRDEKPLLQLIIEKAGHKCVFLPKFHCELNPIEMVWGQLKRRFRELTDGTFPCAQKLVPECLDAVSTNNIRRYFRHCYRYMDAYRKGLNLRQAAYAVKKYKSHRRIPADVMRDADIIARATTAS